MQFSCTFSLKAWRLWQRASNSLTINLRLKAMAAPWRIKVGAVQLVQLELLVLCFYPKKNGLLFPVLPVGLKAKGAPLLSPSWNPVGLAHPPDQVVFQMWLQWCFIPKKSKKSNIKTGASLGADPNTTTTASFSPGFWKNSTGNLVLKKLQLQQQSANVDLERPGYRICPRSNGQRCCQDPSHSNELMAKKNCQKIRLKNHYFSPTQWVFLCQQLDPTSLLALLDVSMSRSVAWWCSLTCFQLVKRMVFIVERDETSGWNIMITELLLFLVDWNGCYVLFAHFHIQYLFCWPILKCIVLYHDPSLKGEAKK